MMVLSVSCFALMLTACYMSERKSDKKVGLNGSFEYSKNGLPVNWLMYTPKTVPNSDFKIVLDTNIYKEGKQSLQYDVAKCADIGDWHSPGFTNEFYEFSGPSTYTVTMWVKNEGATFRVSSGGVKAKGGAMKTVIETNERYEDWEKLEFEVEVAEEMWLRLQLNILSPGKFWIDDIRISKK